MSDAASFILIGGPNGVVLSTIAPTVLDECLEVDDFVNADAIARTTGDPEL